MVTYPSDWSTFSFDEMFQLYPNNTLSRDKLSEHGKIGNIHYGDVLVKYGAVLSEKDSIPKIKSEYESAARAFLQRNDIVVADTAEDETVGKAVQIGDIPIPLVGGLHTIVCRPLVPTAAGYLGYYMNSKEYHEQLLPYITGIKVSSVSKKSIRKTELHIPATVEEQEAIVSAIHTFDTHIANLGELIEKKKAIRDGALDDLMSGRTRLAGYSAKWETIPFGEYFTLLKNNSYSREMLSVHGKIGNIHYGDILVKYGNVVSGRDEIPRLKDEVPFSGNWLLQENDVLIADTAEDETVGKAIQLGTLSFPVVGGLHTIVCRPNMQTAPGFLGYYINSKAYHDQLLPHITGIKVSSISKKSIKTTEVCIPSDIQEQRAIADVLTAMDNEIMDLEDERNKMIQIREGAMDNLLTGRVRLKVQGGSAYVC